MCICTNTYISCVYIFFLWICVCFQCNCIAGPIATTTQPHPPTQSATRVWVCVCMFMCVCVCAHQGETFTNRKQLDFVMQADAQTGSTGPATGRTTSPPTPMAYTPHARTRTETNWLGLSQSPSSGSGRCTIPTMATMQRCECLMLFGFGGLSQRQHRRHKRFRDRAPRLCNHVHKTLANAKPRKTDRNTRTGETE